METHPADVLPLTVAEMDFALAAPVAAALREAVERSDAGYAMAVPGLGRAIAGRRQPVEVGHRPGRGDRRDRRRGRGGRVAPGAHPPGRCRGDQTAGVTSAFDWVCEAGARLLEVPCVMTRPDGALTSARWRRRSPPTSRRRAVQPAQPDRAGAHAGESRRWSGSRDVRVTIVSDEIHGPVVLPGAAFTPLLTFPAPPRSPSACCRRARREPGGPEMRRRGQRLTRHGRGRGPFPADSRWRIGHFGVIASVAAFTAGEPDSTTSGHLAVAGRCSRPCCGNVFPWSAGTRPRRPTWPGSTARRGPGRPGPERFLDHGRVALKPGLSFGAIGWLRPPQLRHQQRHHRPGHRPDGAIHPSDACPRPVWGTGRG